MALTLLKNMPPRAIIQILTPVDLPTLDDEDADEEDDDEEYIEGNSGASRSWLCDYY